MKIWYLLFVKIRIDLYGVYSSYVLANNPQYDTATQIVRYRHLAKSHVSVSIRSLQERGLILGEHKGRESQNHSLKCCRNKKQIILNPRCSPEQIL